MVEGKVGGVGEDAVVCLAEEVGSGGVAHYAVEEVVVVEDREEVGVRDEGEDLLYGVEPLGGFAEEGCEVEEYGGSGGEGSGALEACEEEV